MGSDLTRPKLLLTCCKKEADHALTQVLFDLTQREKIEKFDVFRGNFPNPNPNYRWLTRLDPGSKIFDPDPSLQQILILDYL